MKVTRRFCAVLLMMTMAKGISQAQAITVSSFELDPTDLTAVSHETPDASGRPCALVKVMIIGDGIGFRGEGMLRSEEKGHNEYWVWLSPGAKGLTVQPGSSEPLAVVFSDHDPSIGALKGKHTYQLRLSVQNTKNGQVDVTFRADAPQFDLTIDGYATDPDRRTYPLPYGSHVIKVRAAGYEDFTDTIELNSLADRMDCRIDLTPTPTDPVQQARLADKYLKAKNYARAGVLFRQSADQGCALGQNGMGDLYRYGYGVERDLKKAEKWYKKAADAHLTTAMINLGDVYNIAYHKGKRKDNDIVITLYTKAAEAGDPEGWYKMATEFGYGFPKIREFYRKGAEMGHAGCMAGLGWHYLNAKDSFKDLAKAFHWLSQAAEAGWPSAQFNLAHMYENGLGTEKDLPQALDWYMKAAAGGMKNAAFKVASMFEEGRGVEKDLGAAVAWYYIGALHGDRNAREKYQKLAINVKQQ